MKNKSVQDLHHKNEANANNLRGSEMDTRMLLKKGNRWYLNFTFPKKYPGFEGKKIRISLGTAEHKQAKNLRDKFITPLLTAKTELDVLNDLYKSIVENATQEISRAHQEFKKQLHQHNPVIKLGAAQFSGASNDPSCENIILGQLVDEYVKYMDEHSGLTKGTIAKITSALSTFRFIQGENFKVSDITKDVIDRYVETSLTLPVGWGRGGHAKSLNEVLSLNYTGKTISKANVKISLIYIKSLLTWAMEKEKLPFNFRNPIIEIKSYVSNVKKIEKRSPKEDEAVKLCNMPMPTNEDPISWKYMPIIARFTGMRLSEIAQIQKGDIRRDNGILYIDVCHDTKTTSSKRLVPVSVKLEPYVKELLRDAKSDRVFENSRDFHGKGGLLKYAHGYVKNFNIRAKKISSELSFHSMRHYASTQMHKNGIEKLVRDKILGHSNDSTSAIYTHSDLETMKIAVDVIR